MADRPRAADHRPSTLVRDARQGALAEGRGEALTGMRLTGQGIGVEWLDSVSAGRPWKTPALTRNRSREGRSGAQRECRHA